VKVLVTGVAGFIGSHVAEALLAAGHDVVGLDNLSSGSTLNVPPDVRLHRVDLRQPRAVARVLAAERPDVVNHHAADADVARMNRYPRLGLDVNLLGTANLLSACLRRDIQRIVFVSSAAVYGDPRRLPVDEEQALAPTNPYGVSKAAGELLIRAMAAATPLRYVLLRYANVYGPRQAARAEGGVVASFLDTLERGAAPRVTWDGQQSRDFVYVGDLARANVLALTLGEGRAYNLGTGVPTTINTLLQAVSRAAGTWLEPQRMPRRPGDIRDSYFDCQRARDELGWQATTDLETGLAALVRWRRERSL
jgi:UDP-glucose 4-epimerase